MTTDQLKKFCIDDPAAADNAIKAMRSAVDFHNGRGKLLRSLSSKPIKKTAKKPKLFIVH